MRFFIKQSTQFVYTVVVILKLFLIMSLQTELRVGLTLMPFPGHVRHSESVLLLLLLLVVVFVVVANALRVDVGISNDSADHIRVSSDQPSLRSSRTDYQQSCEYCAIQPLPTSLFDRVNHQIGSQTDQTDWCQTGHQHPGWSPVLMSTDVDLPQCTLLHRPKPLRFRPYQ